MLAPWDAACSGSFLPSHPTPRGSLLLALTFGTNKPKSRPPSPLNLHKNGAKPQHGPYQRPLGPKGDLFPWLNASPALCSSSGKCQPSSSPLQIPQSHPRSRWFFPKPSSRNPQLARPPTSGEQEPQRGHGVAPRHPPERCGHPPSTKDALGPSVGSPESPPWGLEAPSRRKKGHAQGQEAATKAPDVLQDAPRDWGHLYGASSDEMGPPGAPRPSTRVEESLERHQITAFRLPNRGPNNPASPRSSHDFQL